MSHDAFSPADHAAMRDALRQAHQAIGLSDPNPRVGCVLIGASGQRAEGFTQRAGDAHAEVMALRAAEQGGWSPRGATAYVTLEPCAHHGRTPPCCDTLVSAGVARVVVAFEDPNPLVAGQGIARLRAAGIRVDVGLMASEAAELNIGFFHRMRTGRPWVRMKIAASLDGRTALPDGTSQWITSELARIDGHAWRHRAGAILTGVGTVREDDPRMDVRLVPAQGQPPRVVIDSRLETPLSARLLAPPGRVCLYAAEPPADRVAALQAAGAEVVLKPGPNGKVDLGAVIDDLGRREVNELHVEAGHKLNGSLLQAGLVDELLVYLAPKLIGTGREMASFGPLAGLGDALPFEFVQVDPIGHDLRIRARRARLD